MSYIYNYIKSSNESHNKTYCIAIQLYDKDIVDFIMYNMYGYELSEISDEYKDTMQTYRVGQKEYRNALMKRYEKCMITGDASELCDACHIIPYSDCKNYKVDNGLFLTSSLHKLFDIYELTIDAETHRVMIKNPDKHKNYEKYDGMMVKNISNETAKFLAQHNEKYNFNDAIIS